MAATDTENMVFFKLVAQLHEITAQLVQQHRRALEAVVLNEDQLRSNLTDKTALYLGKGIASERAVEVDTAAIEQLQASSLDSYGACPSQNSTGIQVPRFLSVRSMASRFAPEISNKGKQIAANADAELLATIFDQLPTVDKPKDPAHGEIDAQSVLSKAGVSKTPAQDDIDNLLEDFASIATPPEGNESKIRFQTSDNRASVRSVVKSMAGSGSVRAFMMRHPWNEHLDLQNANLSELFGAEGLKMSKSSQIVRRSERIEQEACIVKRYWYMAHPESKSRGLWVVTSLAFLLIDFSMVPVVICFDTDGQMMTHLDLAAMIFWTADILHTFMTGVRSGHHLEMRPTVIACNYLKSWFLFDVGLVLPEWILMLLDSDAGAGIALVRLFRWGRLTRLLRMARIIDFKRAKPMMRQIIYSRNIPKAYIELIISLITVTCELCALVHILTCIWFLLGSGEGGWVELNGLGSSSVRHSYAVSLHWTLGRLHGLQSHNIIQRSSDIFLDVLLLYFSFMLSAYYSGILISFATRSNSESFNLWRLSIIYVRRHRISKETELKINRWLEESQEHRAKEKEQEEQTLLDALPDSVQHDVIFEVRSQSLTETIFFFDLLHANAPAVRQLCIHAMSLKAWNVGEILWGKGDLGISMIFITSGGARYVRESSHEMTANRSLAHSGSALFWTSSEEVGQQDLPIGSAVSEPVLWTQWTHQGALVATDDLATLTIDPINCAAVLKRYRASLCHAVKYAKHFCRKMNLLEKPADDLTRFPLLVYTELDMDDFGDAYEHLMFLSHYKIEAGTEATLMRDSFHKILQDAPNHPANLFQAAAFIDSEDLIDLATLKGHVIGSLNLVLLLTPCVLSRPWCLVEIVTAMRHGIEIVPVEIQRPGTKYSYPDDAYYASILKGEGLPPGAVELLRSEDITLGDVEQAIRQVFLKIALPFSPHKTCAVRDAELHDILARCSMAKSHPKTCHVVKGRPNVPCHSMTC